MKPVVSPVHFQRITPQYAEAMQDLERRCFSTPWSEEQCRSAFTQPAFVAFGLMRGMNLIAYISVYHTANELEILNLGVVSEERRRGFGRCLLEMALRVAGKMGIEKAQLEVRESNHVAICLYQSCGFSKVGIRSHYYSDFGEDALIYACYVCS
ncbi:ribosomal protein S18-alanine N-acetyltransferase [Candidatus Desulfovibrio trichonymphae]|nr:ribosomal protein S18-alanine N-acetyltransferase [Candidatus Desulfovibrio trichonymphae]GHU93857.1 ribosomal-protein-alanine acetyltransferase [Deltaproteobacteria bacterium]